MAEEPKNRLDKIREGHDAEMGLLTDLAFELHRHGEVLDTLTETLDLHTRQLDVLREGVNRNTQLLTDVKTDLTEVKNMVGEVLRRLPPAA